MTDTRKVPPLRELGTDLTRLSQRQRFTALALPFACAAAYWPLAIAGWWPGAVLALIALSFFTYGSTSHDLVHRNMGLPGRANAILLCVIELLAIRSGHAYRAAHLYHHLRYPAEDDIEGAAARMSWPRAIREGLTLQYRVWFWAIRRGGHERRWMLAEGAVCVTLVTTALAAIPWSIVPAIYVGLMIAGSWVIPLVTSTIPHDVDGADELAQTRLFRGRVASIVALEHLYHLEHHLYPAVPHQNWPELARRLDPHFARAGVKPVRVEFKSFLP